MTCCIRRVCGLAICLSSILFPAPGRADIIDQTGVVTQAVVYRRQAEVTRVIEADLPAGSHLVRVPLPSHGEDEFVRARSDESTRILEIKVEREHQAAVTDDQIRSIEDRIHGMEVEKTRQDHIVAGAGARLNLSKEWKTAYNEKLAKETLAQPVTPEAFRKLGDAIFAEQVESHGRILDARERQREIDRQLVALRAELNEIRSRRSTVIRRVVLAVDRKAAGPARLVVEYAAPNAGWSADYDARIDPDEDQMTLSFYGQIRQNTGEPWSAGARVFVSTGDPSQGARMPTLQPIVLSPPEIYEEAELRTSLKSEVMEMSKPAAAPAAAMEPARKMRQVGRESRSQQASDFAQAGVSAVFEVPKLTDLASDGKTHRILIAEMDLPVKLSYRATPSLAEKVYLWVEASNTAKHPLIAGPAQVFVEGAYVGRSDLPTVTTGDTVELSAGVDERLKVKRERLKSESGDRMFGKKITHRSAWRVSVENFRERPAGVTVIERIPTSTHEDIKIELDDVTRGHQIDEKGILRWTDTVRPGQKKTYEYRFTVTVPPGWESVLGPVR